jgi:hypothetical protein
VSVDWVADAVPAVKVTVAVGVMTRLESVVSVAAKASAPAVVDFTVKVTMPEPSLDPEAALMVGEPGPKDFARVTVLPETGLRLASLRVTVIVEVVVPFAVTEVGDATTVEVEADAAPATVVMVALVPVRAPASVAVTVVAVPPAVLVVNTTVAMPLPFVVLVAVANDPPEPDLVQVMTAPVVATGLLFTSASWALIVTPVPATGA